MDYFKLAIKVVVILFLFIILTPYRAILFLKDTGSVDFNGHVISYSSPWSYDPTMSIYLTWTAGDSEYLVFYKVENFYSWPEPGVEIKEWDCHMNSMISRQKAKIKDGLYILWNDGASYGLVDTGKCIVASTNDVKSTLKKFNLGEE